MIKIGCNDTILTNKMYWFMDKDSDERKSIYVKTVKKFGKYILKLNDEFIDLRSTYVFEDYTQSIDILRQRYLLEDFHLKTIEKYLPFIIHFINEANPIYVIRERKSGFNHKDRYLDTSVITEVRYNAKAFKWELKLKSLDKHITTMHSIDSLGLRIFFNDKNAIKKLASLKGGIN